MTDEEFLTHLRDGSPPRRIRACRQLDWLEPRSEAVVGALIDALADDGRVTTYTPPDEPDFNPYTGGGWDAMAAPQHGHVADAAAAALAGAGMVVFDRLVDAAETAGVVGIRAARIIAGFPIETLETGTAEQLERALHRLRDGFARAHDDAAGNVERALRRPK